MLRGGGDARCRLSAYQLTALGLAASRWVAALRFARRPLAARMVILSKGIGSGGAG